MKQTRKHISEIANQTVGQASCYKEIPESLSQMNNQSTEINRFSGRTTQASEDLTTLALEVNTVIEKLLQLADDSKSRPEKTALASPFGEVDDNSLFENEVVRAHEANTIWN